MTSVKSKSFRRRHHSSNSGSSGASSDGDDVSGKVVDILELQKMRKRVCGITGVDQSTSSFSCTPPPSVSNSSTSASNDPLKMTSGGYIDMKQLRHSDWTNANVEDDIKQAFSKESHLRDEDEEMRKFVELELRKRLGKPALETGQASSRDSSPKPDDDFLYALPDRLKTVTSKRNEEMLSQQMLCGIPEVDLGLDAKIKNIEETEAAKLKLLKETMEKRQSVKQKTEARQDVEKERAQSYVQHDRYKIDNFTQFGREGRKLARPPTEAVAVVADDTPQWVEKEVREPVRRPNTGLVGIVPAPRPNTGKIVRPGTGSVKDKELFDKFKERQLNYEKGQRDFNKKMNR